MHEFAITKSMLELVLEHAEKAGGKEVKKINLVIGEMSGVVNECVQFYFNFLSEDTIANGAALCFQTIPTTVRCRGCHRLFELKQFNWSCPDCGANSLEVVAGNELFVESIEVE